MSTPGEDGITLHISLEPSADTLGRGTLIKVPGEGSGRLTLESSKGELKLFLPFPTRAEVRYALDRVIASLSGSVNLGRVSLRGAEPTLATTIGLDLHHRFGGQVELEDESCSELVDAIGAGEDLYRSWVNEDPETRTSIAIAEDVRSFCEGRDDVACEVLREKELQRAGMRLLLAVGGASKTSPPRLVLAHYKPKGDASAPLCLLGKGITFDSGGINVKPYDSYVSMMKNDMGGSALAFSIFRSLVEGGHPKPLLLAVPTCENPVGVDTMKPGALVESHSGKRVRIDHTDAEGRLIMADALSYTTKELDPVEYLCFATLTTSALIAYGPFATPVHFASEGFRSALAQAGEDMGEDFHFFEKRLWHSLANRDAEADLRNTARLEGHAARGAGSRNAAHFLLEFTDKPLCHFDIFASTWNWSGQAPGTGYGATGAPLRSLLQALKSYRGHVAA